MNPNEEHTLSEEELNEYSKELDELFQSLLLLIPPTPDQANQE